MEVILREDVPGLGIIGEVVRVRPGYARNFLIPRGLAVLADARNVKQLGHQQRLIAAKKARERGVYEKLAAEMGAVVVETEARAGRGGKLFGSVTNMEIHRLLTEKGFELDRRRIEIKEPIKQIGEFEVHVRVGQDVDTTIKVVVKPLGGELEDKSVDGEDEPPPAPLHDPESEGTAAAGEGEDDPSASAAVDDGKTKAEGEEQA
ncbi:MAG: 50S ribosomal protein L9 [Candidatus Binatia bacterium]